MCCKKRKKNKPLELFHTGLNCYINRRTGSVARAHTAPAAPKKKKGKKKNVKKSPSTSQKCKFTLSTAQSGAAAVRRPVTDLQPGWETHSRQPDMILWTGRWHRALPSVTSGREPARKWCGEDEVERQTGEEEEWEEGTAGGSGDTHGGVEERGDGVGKEVKLCKLQN